MAIITGTAGNDTGVNSLVGTSSNDTIYGYGGNDTLYGNGGNDTLIGGAGVDAMYGGADNDTYYVDNYWDMVVENANDGWDTILSSLSYTLSEDCNVENLTLIDNALNATGNSQNNQLIGNSFNNMLVGGGGNDNLDGGTGFDKLYGGIGDDKYWVDNWFDQVFESAGEGTDTVHSSFNYTLGETSNIENLVLIGNAINGTGNSFDNNLSGNSLNNTLVGGGGNDHISGGAGADTMVGGIGDDWYTVDNVNDLVAENAGEGYDSINSWVTYSLVGTQVEYLSLIGAGALNATGNNLDNCLIGNSAGNTLDGGEGNDYMSGGLGADTMIGGNGDDTYDVDNVGDIVIENSDSGIDTVRSSISYGFGLKPLENLQLVDSGGAINGYGNSLDNHISGNIHANTLMGGGGDDWLNGYLGADTMAGGIDNDTYLVDDAGDVVTENMDEGLDTIFSTIDFSLAANGSNVEGLGLLEGAAINATGNGLDNWLSGNSLDNTLIGGGGNDTLVGGAGVDTMDGGIGDDTYYVDYFVNNVGDVEVEAAGAGHDTVYSSATHMLSANVEDLWLIESAVAGTGNNDANHIYGNATPNNLSGVGGADTLWGAGGNDIIAGGAGNDMINGGAGADWLYGDADADVFAFFDTTDSLVADPDQLFDFNPLEGDTIELSNIDANTTNGSVDDFFTYIGANAFTGVAGQLNFLNGFVEGDVNGDAIGDFRIQVYTASLSESAFGL